MSISVTLKSAIPVITALTGNSTQPKKQDWANIFQDVKRYYIQAVPKVQALIGQPVYLDHFYLATDSPQEYNRFKNTLKGNLVREVKWKGRRMSILRSSQPLHDGAVAIEMGEPKPNQPESTHVAHLAFRLKGPHAKRDFMAFREKLKQEKIPNVRFLADDMWDGQLSGIKFQIPGLPFQLELKPESVL